MKMNRHKAVFGNNFDLSEDLEPVPQAAEPPPPPPPPIVYDFSDVETARAEGHAAGYAEGIANAAREQSAQLAQAASTLASLLSEASTRAAEVAEEAASAIADLVVSMVGVGYPLLRARYGPEEVSAVARKLLPALMRQPTVRIEVHPLIAEALETELTPLQSPKHPSMLFEATERVPLGDIRITWPNGAAIRETDEAWQIITETLGPFGLIPDAAPSGAAVGAG
jgi:flagellar assembly protein FliH